MKQLNTLPIEDFLEKARIAVKSGQKNLNLSIKEVTDLQHSLSILLTRFLDKSENKKSDDIIQIKMDGGRF